MHSEHTVANRSQSLANEGVDGLGRELGKLRLRADANIEPRADDAHRQVVVLAQHAVGEGKVAERLRVPDGAGASEPSTWVACGLGDGTIAVTDTADGHRHVATMTGHAAGVHALLWLEDKGWLVSGAGDASVRVWRVRSDTVLL